MKVARSAHPVLLGALVLVLAACSRESPAPSAEGETAAGPAPADGTSLDELARLGADVRARSAIRFALADFVKPVMDGDAGIDPYQAPLFYRELSSHDDATHPPELFGRVERGGDGLLRADFEHPAVYFERSTALVAGEERDRIAFAWFFAGDAPGELSPQGLRITFGADGPPAFFEVLGDSSGLDLVFATDPVEDASLAEHGGVLDGRAFALERALDGEPAAANTVVAGLTATGPMALGPFVYLGRTSHDVLDVHCRCEPSRADEIRQNVEYELIPLAELRELGLDPPAWPDAPLEMRLRLAEGREG